MARTLNNRKIAKQFEEDIKKGRLDNVISKAQSFQKEIVSLESLLLGSGFY